MNDRSASPYDSSIPTADLEKIAGGWFLDGEIRQLSERTLNARRDLVRKLVWFLRQRNCENCGLDELRAFLTYVSRGDGSGDRWGRPSGREKTSARTVQSYHTNLKTLFRFLVAGGVLAESPMEMIKAPIARRHQVDPFTPQQLEALLNAALQSHHAKRNVALALFLPDTGCRASEACAVTAADIDLPGRRCRIMGKGGKVRTVVFGAETAEALARYLVIVPRERNEALFLSERGLRMTRSGLLQFCERLGRAAHVEDCHPHRFRHTFAVMFLRAGGHAFALQTLLGHTTMTMTQRYVALAEADLDTAARHFSPADSLRRLKGT